MAPVSTPRSRRSPQLPRSPRSPPAEQFFGQAIEVGGERTRPTSQSVRIVLATPSMSDGPCPVDQRLQSADGHAFGQRCMTSLGLDDIHAAGGYWASGTSSSRLVHAARLTDDLRDHVARPLDDDDVALADLLAADVSSLWSVARDRDAADLDRLHHRPRVQRPVRPTRMWSSALRLGRHRRPLKRAPTAGASATPRRRCWSSRLDHDPVDFVVELDPPLLPLDACRSDVLDRLQPLGVGSYGSRARAASISN